MNKEFIKVRTITDITISSILIISGIILVALPTSVSITLLGSFMLITGTVLLAILKNGRQDSETKAYYCKKERYFAQSSKAKILDALENHIENIDLSDEGKGEGIRMEIYYNRQSGKAFINLFEYIPYNYEPVSPTFEYTTDKITKLIG